ncbi:MAG: hypothetical protein ACFE0O_04615 [Opitutales bacterium]
MSDPGSGLQPIRRAVPEDLARGIGIGLRTCGLQPMAMADRALIAPDGWKYVHRPDDVCELYNLNEDPAEQQNRIGDPTAEKTQDELLSLLTPESREQG